MPSVVANKTSVRVETSFGETSRAFATGMSEALVVLNTVEFDCSIPKDESTRCAELKVVAINSYKYCARFKRFQG